LRCLHTSHASVIFGRTSVALPIAGASWMKLDTVRVVAAAGLEPATQRL
jgi:hypothetical protein